MSRSRDKSIGAESYPGSRGGKYTPDLRKPQRATLGHMDRFSAKLSRRPTFEGAVRTMVDEYGTVPALVMLIPIAFGVVADLDSTGLEVGEGSDFSSMVHGIHAGNFDQGDQHLIESSTQNERLYIDNGGVKNANRSFIVLDNEVPQDTTTGDHYFAPELGWNEGPTHILPIADVEQVALAQSDVTLAAVGRGLVVNTNEIAVLGMHRNAAYLQSRDGRHYPASWNENGVLAIGYDQASGKPFIASAKGLEGNVIFEPEKHHQWQVNVMEAGVEETSDDGSRVVKWSVVGSPVSEPVLQVVTRPDGTQTVELIMPDDKGEMVSMVISDGSKEGGENQFVKGVVEKVSLNHDGGGDGGSVVVEEPVVISETAIVADTEIEGNPFNGQGIELKMLNEITLNTEGDDLMHMADILDQLAAEGKITVKPVTDQRGAMQLGSSADGTPDLVIRPESIPGTRGWQTMFEINDYDFRTFRWQDVTTRPVLIGFNNADGGVIFAQMMVDGSGELKTTGWLLGSRGWEESNGGIGKMVDKFVNFKSNTRDYIHTPVDFASVDACVEYANDEGMRAQCEAIVANRSALRAAYEAMVRTGKVQPDLRNAKSSLTGETLVTLLGFTPAHK